MQDITSWPATVKWAEGELEQLRRKLEGDHDLTVTAGLRGEIRALKRLIARPETAARDAKRLAPQQQGPIY